MLRRGETKNGMQEARTKGLTIRQTVFFMMIGVFIILITLFDINTTASLRRMTTESERDIAISRGKLASALLACSSDDMQAIASVWAGLLSGGDTFGISISPRTLDILRIDFVRVMDMAGRTTLSLHGYRKIVPATELMQSLSPDLGRIAGFVSVGDVIYYLTLHPLYDANRTQEGLLVAGRLIDAAEIAHITSDMGIKFSLHSAARISLTKPNQAILSADGFWIDLNQEVGMVNSWFLYPDLYGENGMIIHISEGTRYSERTDSLIRTVVMTGCAILLLLMLVLYYALARVVLQPLRRLYEQIQAVHDGKASNIHPEASRYIEFSYLRQAIFDMLTKLNGNARAMEKVNASLRMFLQAAECALDEILIFSLDGKLQYINPAAIHQMGYTYESMAKREITDMIALEHRDLFRQILESAYSGNPWQGELIFQHADGRHTANSTSLSPVFNGTHTTPIWIIILKRNMEQMKRFETKLNHIAHHDALTGLPNRYYFFKELADATERAAEQDGKIAVYWIDIDHFKYLNDALGHGTGDQLIQAVASRLSAGLPKQEGFFVARVDGDGFSVIDENVVGRKDSEQVAVTIQSLFVLPFKLQGRGREHSISVSIGSSLFPDDTRDIEVLIKNADEAMYNAKCMGRNQYCAFSPQIHNNIIARVSLENNLRAAILDNCRAFVPYFQPKVDSQTKKIVGSEALIRWITPGGIISPGDFIPIAEETGLIVPISRHMLMEACRYNKSLHEMGYVDMAVSVNISFRVITDGGFLDMLTEALTTSGMAADKLDIEITEDTLMEDVERVNDVIGKISAMGITITVDDFGTGYSSLSYLKKFLVNRLKIDRTFIADIAGNGEDMALVNAIVAMAKALKIVVTAEGVETKTQFDQLSTLRCEEIQGYYVSRPVPFNAFCEFVSAWTIEHSPEN